MLERKLVKGNFTFIIRQDGEQTIISCKGYETTNAHPTMDLKTKQYGYRVNDQEFIKKIGFKQSSILLTDIEEEVKKMFSEKENAKKEKSEEERKQMIKKGVIIKWHDGDYLQAYEVTNLGEELEQLGLAHYVEGWGYKLDKKDIIETLGLNFSLEQAEAYAQNNKKIDKKEIARQEKVQQAIKEAKETGKMVLIEEYLVDCDGTESECSTDIIKEYATPDGITITKRIHTH